MLQLPVDALLGVDSDAAEALKALQVESVFDLATASVFNDAARLNDATENPRNPLAQFGAAPPDMVRADRTPGMRANELAFESLDVLAAIPEAEVTRIASALDVETVAELAAYPPYRAAMSFVDAVFFPENDRGFDAESPPDLVPTSGDYATERVQYTTLLMDEIKTGSAELVDVESDSFTPLDVSKLAEHEAGFRHIAFGALLTFNQSWYSQGVALGQLLHSTALAPGESTRIAMIDWSRRSRAGESEAIDETDALAADVAHSRSISEVTHAVANEAQAGFSKTHTHSKTDQWGASGAGETGGGVPGVLFGESESWGATESHSVVDSRGDSFSTSAGRREIGASMLQNVNDRTHQHAHSNRSRRASVVKEVSQSEHEGVSTRVVTNYNHMHALTVQYYEVVQIFRVEVALTDVDRVIFVPVRLPDFRDDDTIRRFRRALQAAALTQRARDALARVDTVEIAPDEDSTFSVFGIPLGAAAAAAGAKKFVENAVGAAMVDASKAETKINAPPPSGPPRTPDITVKSAKLRGFEQIRSKLWSGTQATRLASVVGTPVVRQHSASIFLPADVVVEDATVTASAVPGADPADAPALDVAITRRSGERVVLTGDLNLAAAEIDRIAVVGGAADADVDATVTLTVSRNGVPFRMYLPTVKAGKTTTSEAPVVQVRADAVDADLKAHLQANQLHYSQAVLRDLNTMQIAILLAGNSVTVDGTSYPVSQVVEPRPVAFVGNYLAFRMSTDTPSGDRADESEWARWLDERGIRVGETRQELVPLASGGTFAEAVLGRFNSAEKLDITRFWNWQDSPIPIQPPEITAIQTGSRGQPEDVKPGQLSPPIVNIQQPPAVPDPVGMAGALAAVQNGNMFRDMSGLDATAALAQAALQASSAGAATAGQQAGSNMATHMQAQTERMRILADLAKTVIGAATGTGALMALSGSGSGSGSHSQDGAKINYFDSAKGPAKAGGGAGAGQGGGAVAPVEAGSSGGGPTEGFDAGGWNGEADTGGGEWSQNPGLLAATWGGDSGSPSQLVEKLVGGAPFDETGASVVDSIEGVRGSRPVVGPFPIAVLEEKPNPKLADALETALRAAEKRRGLSPETWPIPITVMEVSSASPGAVAGHLEKQTDYIASEAKVCVMYAAYALRDMVRRFANVTGATAAQPLFKDLRARMNPEFEYLLPRIANDKPTEDWRLPKYEKAFAVKAGGGGLAVEFSPTLETALKGMIDAGQNAAAEKCVRLVGYAYLNGLLAHGGFFDPSTNTGLWVGGDYTDGAHPYVRIPTHNDVDGAFTGTTRTMARLVSLIKTNGVLDSRSHDEMLGHLKGAVAGDPPWTADVRGATLISIGKFVGVKIGLGNLKDRRKVWSEVAIVQGIADAQRTYVVAWQNLVEGTGLGVSDISRVITAAITAYESP